MHDSESWPWVRGTLASSLWKEVTWVALFAYAMHYHSITCQGLKAREGHGTNVMALSIAPRLPLCSTPAHANMSTDASVLGDSFGKPSLSGAPRDGSVRLFRTSPLPG
jgi:hypothetical protein